MHDETSSRLPEDLNALVSRIRGGDRTIAPADLSTLESVAAALAASQEALSNAATWLRTQADLAISRPPDPEQPGYEEFARGWSSGSYNSLHMAANAVEDGRASLPRDQWPPYMRGEVVRPSQSPEDKETTNGASS